MTRPLEGINVLELSEHGFVPSSVAALADFGADVIKIERTRGDAMRGIIGSGMVDTVDDIDYLFELVNRNKRGIALDIETDEGREVFERLVKWADVYVTNQLPQVRRKLKTEPDDLFALNPKLVYAKGHGQGQRGADAEVGGFDGVSYWARGGMAHLLTDPEASRPAQQRPALGDVPTGMFLAGGVCAALVRAQRTGEGIVVDVSLLGGAAWALGPDLAYTALSGDQLVLGAGPGNPIAAQYRTADGRFISLMMINEQRYWDQACRAMKLPELIEPYTNDPEGRIAARPELGQKFGDAIASFDSEDLKAALKEEGCIFSFMATPAEVLEDPAVVENNYAMQHPTIENLKLSAAPAQFDDELPSIRRGAPSLGEHSREVLQELGYPDADIDRFASGGVIVDPS